MSVSKVREEREEGRSGRRDIVRRKRRKSALGSYFVGIESIPCLSGENCGLCTYIISEAANQCSHDVNTH